MNLPGSREELEGMGFTFERRCHCKAPECGATLEWWRAVSGRWIPFRLHPRTGRLIQHTDECPSKGYSQSKSAKVKPEIAERPKPEKKKVEAEPQGVLFR